MPRPSSRSLGGSSSFLQQHERSLVPIGTSTGLPLTAQRIRRLEDTLLRSLSRWGYQEIIPPTFEYLDVLAAGLDSEVIENCFKFGDRTTGRILLLRPDVTAQVARIVAMGMVGREFPIRLGYRTTVFRFEPEHAGRDREIFQVGAELIGVDDIATDAEMIALMVECLQEIGIPTFNISLGHVGFFKGLLNRTGMSREGRKRAEQAASRKDLPRLEEILISERVSKAEARALLEVPGLSGREEVLHRGRVLAGKDEALRVALDRLSLVYALLIEAGMQDHLILDLGEFRGFDYYDGIAFDVFAQGVGYELGGGGRYNHLIGRFGQQVPSTGFAFDVARLFQALEGLDGHLAQPSADILVSATPKTANRLFQISTLLRAAGFRVVHGKLRGRQTRPLDKVLAEGRRLGVSTVVIVGTTTIPADEVLALGHPRVGLAGVGKSSSRSGRQRGALPGLRMTIQDLPGWASRPPVGRSPA